MCIILIFYFAVVSHWTYILPFLVTTAKLIGEARRLDVRALLILSCPLCCANTICTAIRAPLIGEAERINKNPWKQRIVTTKASRFAYTVGADAFTASPIFPEFAYNLDSTDRNRNMVEPRWNPNKTTKECSAPQFEAPTFLLTSFSTYLSFRWTLPLMIF